MLWFFWVASLAAPPVVLSAAADIAPESCGRDAHEPNNERRLARPAAPGEARDGAVCATDEDWFRFPLERGAVVDVVLVHHPTARLPPPQVFAPRSRKATGRAVPEKRGRHRVRVTARRAGIYRVRVRSPEAVRAAYTLTVEPPSKPAARYPARVAGKPSTRR